MKMLELFQRSEDGNNFFPFIFLYRFLLNGLHLHYQQDDRLQRDVSLSLSLSTPYMDGDAEMIHSTLFDRTRKIGSGLGAAVDAPMKAKCYLYFSAQHSIVDISRCRTPEYRLSLVTLKKNTLMLRRRCQCVRCLALMTLITFDNFLCHNYANISILILMCTLQFD